MVLFPRIACDPPLGQVTAVHPLSASFLVALDWNHTTQSLPGAASYEVVVWHNGTKDGQWTALKLDRISPSVHHSNVSQQYFQGHMDIIAEDVQSFSFTLKIRSASSDWQWVNQTDPEANGEVIFTTDHDDPRPSSLSDVFHNLDPRWSVDNLPSPSSQLTIWSLRSDVEAAKDDKSGRSVHRLGLPKSVSRWFALVRHSTPWLAPRQGKGPFSPDKEAILASFLREDGQHAVVLALNGTSDVLTTFGGDDNGHIVVSACNDSPEPGQANIYIALGPSFEEAVKWLMDYVRDRASATWLGPTGRDIPRSGENDENDQELEQWRDGFSYCTWNGVGQSLNEDKIIGALESLAKNDIDITNLIIDDNWQSLDYKGDSNFNYRWTAFDANKENFPQGLKHTISRIREMYPYIEHIAVWHGIFGYWNGISPMGEIAKQYHTKEVVKSGREGYMGGGTTFTVAADDVHRLYDEFYRFLTEAGVDSVKADVQFYPDYLEDAPDRRAMMYAYQDAWTAATQKYFQGRAISCMSMTPQILFHSLLFKDKPCYMARNSDDFFPFDPNSHTWHIFTNAHNTLLTQHLNILPDWDMFQTVHEYAGMHAAARCLSGGPIYITDTPGQHDINLIHQMTAKSIAGRSMILRPHTIGHTMEQYVPAHSSRFLRIGTTHFKHSMLGLFNIGRRTRVEIVRLASFRDIQAKTEYVIRKHKSGHVFGPFRPGDDDAFASARLDPKGYEILTAHPCWSYGGITAAVLGLVGKMSGAAVITGYRYLIEDGTMCLSTECKAVGRFGLYLRNARHHLGARSLTALFRIDDSKIAMEIQLGKEENVLEFDTEAACKTLLGKTRGTALVTAKATVEIRVRLPDPPLSTGKSGYGRR